MNSALSVFAQIACACALLAAVALPAHAKDEGCGECHADLVRKKVVHDAVDMGCSSCHAKLESNATPHKYKGKVVGKGLTAEVPALCDDCHEDKLFKGKFVHGPVASGQCTGCHNPHASDNVAMLKKEPAALCLECHEEVRKKPHMIVGFTGGGHPLGDVRKAKEVMDPLRSGKPFYCVACHEPHRSDRPKLMRFDKGMSSCQPCHKM